MTDLQLADANYEHMRADRDKANADFARVVDEYLDVAYRLHCAKLLLHEQVKALGAAHKTADRQREQMRELMTGQRVLDTGEAWGDR